MGALVSKYYVASIAGMAAGSDVEPEYFSEIRVYFDQSRAGDCWNSGKTKFGLQ